MGVRRFEKELRRQVEARLGERWPLVAYVVYARVTDPESMTHDAPFWLVPDGQRSFVTRGLLEEASSEHEMDSLPTVVYVDVDDDWEDGE
jgi:hypothetical protein